jgi:hypothetical protein
MPGSTERERESEKAGDGDGKERKVEALNIIKKVGWEENGPKVSPWICLLDHPSPNMEEVPRVNEQGACVDTRLAHGVEGIGNTAVRVVAKNTGHVR